MAVGGQAASPWPVVTRPDWHLEDGPWKNPWLPSSLQGGSHPWDPGIPLPLPGFQTQDALLHTPTPSLTAPPFPGFCWF